MKKDKELKLFEGASQGLFADPETKNVIATIKEWLVYSTKIKN